MKAKKLFSVVGISVCMIMGVTACGPTYTGEGTVVSKEIDKERKSTGTGKKKRTKTVTEYEVNVSTNEGEIEFDVPSSQYNRIQVGQKVTIQNGRIQ